MMAMLLVLSLWPGKAPHAVGDSKWRQADRHRLPGPEGHKANGTAVVICPGGGYGFLADDHEGKQVAEFLNKLGVTAFVLQVPHRHEGPPRPAAAGPARRRPARHPHRPAQGRRSTASTRPASASWASPPAATSPAPRARTSTTGRPTATTHRQAELPAGLRRPGYPVISIDPA